MNSLAQVIDTIPAFISAAGPDGGTVFTNASHAALRNNHGMGAGEPMLDGALPDGPATAAAAEPDGPVFGDEYEQRSRALDQLVFRTNRPLPAFEQEVTDRTGDRRMLLTTKSPLRGGDGRVGSVLTTSLDITERKIVERHLQHVASHDGLTDLPNRLLLRERLQQRLSGLGRPGTMLALLLLDLDRFKEVNDQMGHHLGDALLRIVASKLLDCVGAHDTVARIGGDEFAILQTRIGSREEAAALAARIIAGLKQLTLPNGQDVPVSGSIGIAVAPADATDAQEMLRSADPAMYQVKQEGRNDFHFFVPDMGERARRMLRLRKEVRLALRSDQFLLHYQPQMNLRSGRISSFEALLRWSHPVDGLLLPADFLLLAEEAGFSVEIDDWVLRRACRDAVFWQQGPGAGIGVAVNMSPVRIGMDATRRMITAVLDETGLDPALLELELTERELVEDLDAAAVVLRELRTLGVRVAIDDFGTGYSFLNHVKNFPVDRLKIDRSFVRNLRTDPSDAAIVRAVIHLAHGMGMGVVAEGVETVDELSHLSGEGCDEIQGYYFGAPMALDAAVERITAERAVPRSV